jgi:hypothetical protein
MKKILLSLLLLTGCLGAYSQGPLTKNWEVLATTTSGALIGNTSLQTTIAYNKVTDKLYLPERNNKINILNPTTGTLSSPSTLAVLPTSTNAAWAASNKYTKMRVTNDGVIYACNLATAAGTVYIYRWASETDVAPTTSAITITARTGDSFAVTGTGVNTIIYLSGSGNNEIYVCTTADGVNFTLDRKITGIGGTSTGTHARTSISLISNSLTSDLWINVPNDETRRISVNSTGAITSTSSVATSVISQLYGNTEYIQEGNEKYLAVTGAVIGGSYNAATGLGFDFKLYKITNFASPPTTGVTEIGTGKLSDVTAAAPSTFYQNTNAYADVAYKKNANGTYTFYNLICNNGMAAYTTASTLPVSLTSFTATAFKDFNQLNWTTASESNNRGFDVQRSVDGQEFINLAFVSSKAVQGNSSISLSYNFQDKTAPAGTLYYRLKQVDLNGNFEYSDIKSVRNNLTEISAKLYPNPVQNDLIINIPLEFKGLSYSIHNMVGQEFMKGKTEELTRINVAALVPGIYYVKIVSAQNETQSLKFIKQ